MDISPNADRKAKNFSSVPNLPNGHGSGDPISSSPRITQSSIGSHPHVTDNSETEVRRYHVRIQENGSGTDLDSPNPPDGFDPNDDRPDDLLVTRESPCCLPAGCNGNNRRPVPVNLSYIQRIFIGSGHILNDLCASLWFSYLLLYLEKVVGFSSTSSAALLLLGQIVDGLSTPLIGYEADRANHCFLCRRGYGRCKSWHLIGVILVMISFPFVFSPCIGCEGADEWAKAVYYAPFIAIFQIGWASTQISHLALIPKMNHDVLVRTELLAIRYGFTIAANVTVFLMTWFTLGFNEECVIDSDDAPVFRNIALMAVAIGGVFSLLFHLFVVEKSDEEIKNTVSLLEASGSSEIDEDHRNFGNSLSTVTDVRSITSSVAISKCQTRRRRNSTPSVRADGEAGRSLLSDHDDDDSTISRVNTTSTVPSGVSTITQPSPRAASSVIMKDGRYSTKSLNLGRNKMSLTDWLTLPQFYIVAVMYMSTRLSVNLTQVYMPLYLQETLHLPCGSVATIPLTMYCSGFIVAIFIKMINKYLGRQLAYTFGAVLSIIGSSLILFLDWQSGSFLVQKGIYIVAALLGGGASAILVTSLSITADMIGNNVENGAFVYGAMSFCDKLSCGIVVMLINSVNPCVKNDDKCNDIVPFYKHVLGYACGGCALVGVLGVLGLTYIIYRQNKKKEAEVEDPYFESDLMRST